jgi:hypothetical protein
MTTIPENLHKIDCDTYERIGELNIVCHRVELIEGIIQCHETGRPFTFSAADFDRLVAAGVIDPARVALENGYLVTRKDQ